MTLSSNPSYKSYRDKTVAFFQPGQLRSKNFRKLDAFGYQIFVGRENQRGIGIYTDVDDDEQFSGKAFECSTDKDAGIKSDANFGTIGSNIKTYSIWFKLASINSGTFFKGVYDAVRLWNSGTQIRINGNTNTGGTPAIFDIPTISVDTWYHLVVILDAGNDLARVFLNGVESTSGSQTIIPELNSLARIGVYNGIDSINVDGKINHIGHWNKALSQAEIEQLYGFQIPVDQCLFYLTAEQQNNETTVYSIIDSALTFSVENPSSPGSDWVDDSDFPFSWLNQKGYSVSGGDYIPASLSNPGQDVLSNSLQIFGTLAPRLLEVDDSGTTKYQLPDIPGIHSSLKGTARTFSEWVTFSLTSDYLYLNSKNDMLITSEALTTNEILRNGFLT